MHSSLLVGLLDQPQHHDGADVFAHLRDRSLEPAPEETLHAVAGRFDTACARAHFHHPTSTSQRAHSRPGLLPARIYAPSDASAAMLRAITYGHGRRVVLCVSDALGRRGPPSSFHHDSLPHPHMWSKHACCALRGFGAIPHERRYQASWPHTHTHLPFASSLAFARGDP